jgi:hypothetical protein
MDHRRRRCCRLCIVHRNRLRYTCLSRTLTEICCMICQIGPYFDFGPMADQGCVDMFLDMGYSCESATGQLLHLSLSPTLQLSVLLSGCIRYEAHSVTRNRAPSPLPWLTAPTGCGTTTGWGTGCNSPGRVCN